MKLFKLNLWMLVFVPLFTTNAQNAINITSTSSTTYTNSPGTAIYPAFVDGLNYQSWTTKGATPYHQLSAKGGELPYTWKLTAGQLPSGIKLSQDGKLSGLPTRQGTFNFTVRATDKLGRASTKKLSLQALPYRAKWFSDAGFGIMIQWGAFVPPSLSTKEQLAQFEQRISKFDAEKWAQTVSDLGGKILNFTVKAGDGVRMWPSKVPSKYNLTTKRNIVGELIAACHKRGIKFIAYIAPDHGWNKAVQDVAADGSIGTLNKDIVEELLAMGVDGFWIDMGGTPELHPGSDPKWFPWKEIIPLIRTKNPRAIFASNPGLGQGGTILKWPDTDMVVYEGRMAADEYAFVTAKPITVKKKIAIEVDNLLDTQWAWTFNEKNPQKPKTAEMVINNIRENWKVGATYLLNYPVPANGDIMPAIYKPILSQIGSFVKRNGTLISAPTASLRTDSMYTGAQTVNLKSPQNSVIYYTIDGTEPSSKSLRYSAPIRINKTTMVKAIAITNGKAQSRTLSAVYRFSSRSGVADKSARAAAPENVESKPDSQNYYRGMRITVGRSPILLETVGRRFVAGNSNEHPLIIKRYSDDHPVLSESINAKIAKKESDGFQYVDMPSIKLEAGKSYIIAFRESTADKFAFSRFANTPRLPDGISFNEHFILSPNGDRTPVKDDGIGQLVSLEFKTIGKPSENIALGATAQLLDNLDKPLKPIRGVLYPENAVDGDNRTVAMAGGKYAWTLSIDLGNVEKNVSRCEINFDKASFSTHFRLFSSHDGKNWKQVATVDDNSKSDVSLTFAATDVKFFKLRSIKPDAPGQKGNGMSVKEFRAYK